MLGAFSEYETSNIDPDLQNSLLLDVNSGWNSSTKGLEKVCVTTKHYLFNFRTTNIRPWMLHMCTQEAKGKVDHAFHCFLDKIYSRPSHNPPVWTINVIDA